MHRTPRILAVLALLVPVAVGAHIHNGDFEKGGDDWTVTEPANWTVTFPATGGNPDGYAQIRSPFGNSAGFGSISQEFDCGTKTSGLVCVIMFDYQLTQVDANNNSGRIKVLVDGQLLFTSPSGDVGWSTGIVTMPCGDHEITLGLEVDPGNNGWQASFDNAHAECDIATPVPGTTWGSIKEQFDSD